MTDLTEMVEWLRREIQSDKTNAQYAHYGACASIPSEIAGDSDPCDCDLPRDTIARCEAELAIIDEHYPVDPCDAHDANLETIACPTLEHLASGYRHRPGWKDGHRER